MTNEYSWIAHLAPKVQLAAFRRLAAYLSSRELMQVMQRIREGESVYEAHRDTGLIARYYVHLLRIIDDVESEE